MSLLSISIVLSRLPVTFSSAPSFRPASSIADSGLSSLASSVEMPYGTFSGYFTYTELNTYLDGLSERNPELATPSTVIGKSIEGRDIKAVCLGRCARAVQGTQVDAAPEVFYNGLIHGREPMSMAALVYFVEYLLLASSRGDPEVSALLHHRDLWFVMNLNPDAYEANFVRQKGGRCGVQRKNTRDSCSRDTSRSKKGGVDLNRNFPVCFSIDDEGSSSNTCKEDYRGEKAFSEPEAQAMRDFVNDHSFSIALSYHSFGRFINQPYMCKKEQLKSPSVSQDLEFFKRFGEACTTNAPGNLNRLWEYGHPWDSYLYTVNGDASDWMYHDHGIYAMAPEVGPECPSCKRIRDCDGFWPPKDQILSLAQETLILNLQAMRLAGPALELKSLPKVVTATDTENDHCTVSVEVQLENIGARQAQAPITVALFQGDVHAQSAPTEVQLGMFKTQTVTLKDAQICGAEGSIAEGRWSLAVHMHDLCTVMSLSLSMGSDAPAFTIPDGGEPTRFMPCHLLPNGNVFVLPHGRSTEAVGGSGEIQNVGDTKLEEEIQSDVEAGSISVDVLSYIDIFVWLCALLILGGLAKLYCERRKQYHRLYSTDAARAVVSDGFYDIIHGKKVKRGSGGQGTGSSSFGRGRNGSGGFRHGGLHDDPYALSSDDDYSVASSNTDY